jgi:glucosyl-dolichyl phosphate glucuronosyltransferase
VPQIEIKISIIIATFNRAEDLYRLLRELSFQFEHCKFKSAFEFIVVNNNSTDHTFDVANSFVDELPIKYLEEKQQGLSRAQNKAILESTGNLICFVDDDVIPYANWLIELHKIASSIDLNKAQGFSGRIKAQFSGDLPNWLSFKSPFSVTPSVFPFHDYGEEEHKYPFLYHGQLVQNPIGANFLFTRKVFECYGLFREDLGAGSHNGYGKHGDTEFTRYLINHSIEMHYKPSLQVTHPVNEERINKDYIRNWYKKSGFSLFWLYRKQRTNFNLRNPNDFVFVGLPLRFRKYMPRFLSDFALFNIPLYILIKLQLLLFAYLLSFLFFYPKCNFWLSVHLFKAYGEAIAAKKLFSTSTLAIRNFIPINAKG